MPAVSYLFPPDNSQAKSVALTSYASGLLVGRWDTPTVWYGTLSSYTSAAFSLSTTNGFSAATVDPSGNAWLPQYYGGLAHYSSGGNLTEYLFPQADVITGCAYVKNFDSVYAIGATGTIYSGGNGIIPPTFFLGHSILNGPDILGSTVNVLTVGSGFIDQSSWFLGASGTTLFTLLPGAGQLGYFNLSSSGVGTSGAVTLPMLIPSCLSVSQPASSVVVGGWGYTAISSGFSFMFSDPAAYWTIGLTPTANTIGVYYNAPWGGLSFSQAITGVAVPTYGNWAPDGLHFAVTSPPSGVVIFNSIFGTISPQTTLSVSGAGPIAFVSPSNLVVCQPLVSSITSFSASGSLWSQNNSLTLNNPSTVASTGPFAAAVGYASGIAFVNISQANQLIELDSTVNLPFNPSSITTDVFGNIYAVGTQGNSGYLSIFSGHSLSTTLNWFGSGSSVGVFQDQIVVLDPVEPVLRIFGFYQGVYQQISAIFSLPSDVSGGVFVTPNTPFSSGGVALVCGSGAVWSYQFVSPFGLVNVPNGVVAVYNNNSWTTTVLGSGKVPSAVVYDSQLNLWVTTVQDDLYSLTTLGGIQTHDVIPPYTGQLPSTPLGISSLITLGPYLYGVSSLNGGLVSFNGGFPIPLPPPFSAIVSVHYGLGLESLRPVLTNMNVGTEIVHKVSIDTDINIEIGYPIFLLTNINTGLEFKESVQTDTDSGVEFKKSVLADANLDIEIGHPIFISTDIGAGVEFKESVQTDTESDLEF